MDVVKDLDKLLEEYNRKVNLWVWLGMLN
jgi:hypothetical protein